MIYDLSNQYKVQCAEEYFAKLKAKRCIVEIKEKKLKRSSDQNALYWLWLTYIQKETGNDKDEMHCLYRANFLPREEEYILQIIRPDLWDKIKPKIESFHYFKGLDQIIDIISFSTTDQDQEHEFGEYLTKIRNHAMENMDVILLTLEEQGFQDFYREYGFY